MPPFPKPRFSYDYELKAELKALESWRDNEPGRQVPAKSKDNLLLLTWNIANCGLQERRESDYALIAKIISWFDLIALQEVNDNLSGLAGIRAQLPSYYRALYSDAAGNNERLTFLYNSRKVKQLEEVGELALPPSDLADIAIPGVSAKFQGFDRNPYLGLFQAGSFVVQLASVHLYFGGESGKAIERRKLETFAVAWWADRRRKSKNASTANIIPLADFNLPKSEPGDPIYDQLTSRGLHLPAHSTAIGSSIAADEHYDQIAFSRAGRKSSSVANRGSLTSTAPSFASSGSRARARISWPTSATTSPTTAHSGPSSRSRR